MVYCYVAQRAALFVLNTRAKQKADPLILAVALELLRVAD